MTVNFVGYTEGVHDVRFAVVGQVEGHSDRGLMVGYCDGGMILGISVGNMNDNIDGGAGSRIRNGCWVL